MLVSASLTEKLFLTNVSILMAALAAICFHYTGKGISVVLIGTANTFICTFMFFWSIHKYENAYKLDVTWPYIIFACGTPFLGGIPLVLGITIVAGGIWKGILLTSATVIGVLLIAGFVSEYLGSYLEARSRPRLP